MNPTAAPSALASPWIPGPAALLAAAGFAVFALLTHQPLTSLLGLAVLLLILRLTWRSGEPPVMAFVLGFQWLQAALLTLYADVSGARLNALASYSCADVDTATLYSLLGVAAVAIGARIGTGAQAAPVASVPVAERALWLYVVSFVAGLLLQTLASGGLRQPMLALASVHWAGYYLLAWTVLRLRRHYLWLVIATLLEFGLGFSGFFSSFKTPLFVLAIAMSAAHIRLRPGALIALISVVVFTMTVGIYWQSTKDQYRNYINRGSQQQVVLVPFNERMNYLADLFANVDVPQFASGAESLVQRIAYVDFFGCVINRVPRQLPHEDGALWQQAIAHAAVPRLLNPEKAVLLSDSELTSRYTGLGLASDAEGTSISMGYMAESYIDFGPWGMLLPLLAVGYLLGRGYRHCVQRQQAALGQAAAVALLIGFYALEINNTKLLGGYLVTLLALALTLRVAGVALESWLLARRPGPP